MRDCTLAYNIVRRGIYFIYTIMLYGVTTRTTYHARLYVHVHTKQLWKFLSILIRVLWCEKSSKFQIRKFNIIKFD